MKPNIKFYIKMGKHEERRKKEKGRGKKLN